MYKQIIIKNDAGTRLDRYLRRLYPTMTQGIIEKSLRAGKIKVNHKKTASNYRVNIDDILEISLDLDERYIKHKSEQKFDLNTQKLAQKIIGKYLLYQSDDLIIIDKPAGLAVQGGSKINLSVDCALSYLNYHQASDYKLVHRLDKNTSGILLIAKNAASAAKLTDGFFHKLISKTYCAVVYGRPINDQGVIKNKLAKIAGQNGELIGESPQGKIAETQYKLLSNNGNYSLIEYRPLTGRMHQLRSHSKSLGCPILGDVKYGGQPYIRMMLHASNIFIPSQILGYDIELSSPLPYEFTGLF